MGRLLKNKKIKNRKKNETPIQSHSSYHHANPCRLIFKIHPPFPITLKLATSLSEIIAYAIFLQLMHCSIASCVLHITCCMLRWCKIPLGWRTRAVVAHPFTHRYGSHQQQCVFRLRCIFYIFQYWNLLGKSFFCWRFHRSEGPLQKNVQKIWNFF